MSTKSKKTKSAQKKSQANQLRTRIVKAMNNEIKKVVSAVKEAQEKLQTLIKGQDWVEEARKYAERQGKEVKKLLSSDVGKVKTFLERERKELEKMQKQLPGEVKKFRKYVQGQRKEFEKLLTGLRKLDMAAGAKKVKSKKKSSASSKKRASRAKKPASSSSANE